MCPDAAIYLLSVKSAGLRLIGRPEQDPAAAAEYKQWLGTVTRILKQTGVDIPAWDGSRADNIRAAVTALDAVERSGKRLCCDIYFSKH